MRDTLETANADTGKPKPKEVFQTSIGALVVGVIIGVASQLIFGTGLFTSILVLLVLGVILGLRIINSSLVALAIGVIVGTVSQLVFGTGLFTAILVLLIVGMIVTLLPEPEVSNSGASSTSATVTDKSAVSSALRGKLLRVSYMTGQEFEWFMADVFEALGFKVTLKGTSGD
jgi:hypothetical protein